MPDPAPHSSKSLRLIVLESTGQDVRRCGRCAHCQQFILPGEDVSLETLLMQVLLNDDEVLTSHTLWSEAVLTTARQRCLSTLNLPAVLLELRAEAQRRGLADPPAPIPGDSP